ncbi:hypothetical protein VNO78_14665 [Psophocarpus tetragonolobus]|uniref:30S ribosomal protein 3, chloroplastic n=1 Tax=Psophocarpus tetragonolobus TaxID=3891 RepID=A0AAN9SDV7_PSOTE
MYNDCGKLRSCLDLIEGTPPFPTSLSFRGDIHKIGVDIGAPTVSYLFVDDCFAFLRAYSQECSHMKNILSLYEKASIEYQQQLPYLETAVVSVRHNEMNSLAMSMALVHPLNSTKLKSLVSVSHVPSESPARFRNRVSASASASQPEKLGVVVKAMEKPRLVLKFIWMEKNIGIALDQMVAGHGTIPLSPYYFWPRKDAWEELKELLETKPWISQKQMIILLNQATDIINLWQQSGANLS